jgi:superfamily II DNA helicase RecQ
LNPLAKLRKYWRDPAAQFKSHHQWKLLEFVTERNHTLAVMPTGLGKSIAYELPPIHQGQLTLVTIPYRVIVSQALQNAWRHGVAAEVWRLNTPRTIEKTRLVIVPYDCILQNDFIE